jgi:ATP synthase protein I
MNESTPTIKERIAKAQANRAERKASIDSGLKSLGKSERQAFTVIADLAVPMVVGGGLGYAVDDYFALAPIFTVVLVILGFAAGLYNMYKRQQGLGLTVGLKKKSNGEPPSSI